MGHASSTSSDDECDLVTDASVIQLEELKEHFTQIAKVSVVGVRIRGGFVHHGIIIQIPGLDKYWAFDWGVDGGRMLKGDYERGIVRKKLGRYSIQTLCQAFCHACEGKAYNIGKYNCNHWTNKFAKFLGWKLKCGCLII